MVGTTQRTEEVDLYVANLDCGPGAIGEHYGFRLDAVNPKVDPTFRFMAAD